MQRQSMNKSSLQAEIALLRRLLASNPSYSLKLNDRLNKLNHPSFSSKEEIEMDSIESIDRELREVYEVRNINKLVDDDELVYLPYGLNGISFISLRVRYLLDRRKYLVTQQKLNEASRAEILPAPIKAAPHPVKAFLLKVLHKAKAVYNVAKKIVDIIDDLWRCITKPLKSLIPVELVNAITPFLIGSTNLFIHFCEGMEGLLDAIKAIKKTKTVARTTKIITGFLIAAIGATGTGLSASYIASATGAVVLGAQFMPVLIPALLTCIFIVGLSKNIDILKTVNKLYKKERVELKRLSEVAKQLDLTNAYRIGNLEQDKGKLIVKRNLILSSIKDIKNIAIDKQEQLKAIEDKISEITKEQNFHSFKVEEAHKAVEKQKAVVEKFREKKLAAERDVAFKTIELTASLIVLAGTILGTAAILGAASVATLGFLPLGLVITGVVIASAFKLFEYIDGKKDNKYSNGLRNFFTDKVGPLFGRKKKFEAAVDERYRPEEVQPLIKPNYKRSSSTANMFTGLEVNHRPKTTTNALVTGKTKPVAVPAAKSAPVAALPIPTNDFAFSTPSDRLALSRSRN